MELNDVYFDANNFEIHVHERVLRKFMENAHDRKIVHGFQNVIAPK